MLAGVRVERLLGRGQDVEQRQAVGPRDRLVVLLHQELQALWHRQPCLRFVKRFTSRFHALMAGTYVILRRRTWRGVRYPGMTDRTTEEVLRTCQSGSASVLRHAA